MEVTIKDIGNLFASRWSFLPSLRFHMPFLHIYRSVIVGYFLCFEPVRVPQSSLPIYVQPTVKWCRLYQLLCNGIIDCRWGKTEMGKGVRPPMSMNTMFFLIVVYVHLWKRNLNEPYPDFCAHTTKWCHAHCYSPCELNWLLHQCFASFSRKSFEIT